MLVFDIETDGFLKEMTKIHCVVIHDLDTGHTERYNDQSSLCPDIETGVKRLMNAGCIIGHNIQKFDIPAIKKIYPWFNPQGTVMDTLVMSKLIYINMKEIDYGKREKKYPDMPGNLVGRHSLKAWGYRFHFPKDDYAERMKEQGLDPWAQWSQEMEDYCVQDVMLNVRLWESLIKKGFTYDSIDLEQKVDLIIERQIDYGFLLNEKLAQELHCELLKRKLELTTELQKLFPPFFVKNGKAGSFKKDQRRFVVNKHGAHIRKRKVTSDTGRVVVSERGYWEHVTAPDEWTEDDLIYYQKVKLVDFNPGSRDHIANRLKYLYKWKPKAFGADGKPTVDEETMSSLKYPVIPSILKYLTVDKRLGQLAEGNEAVLRVVHKDGRMHGRVNPLGAVTSRMTHSKPNVAQTPANYSDYGEQFRALYTVPTGKKLVGCDADALELCCLAGYMAKWDAGEYIKIVLEGDKSKGTDIHTRNMHAIGITSRDDAKTWFYAFIYGAGDEKLGRIIAASLKKQGLGIGGLCKLGSVSRSNFEKNLPALGKLVKSVKKAVKRAKRIRGLDGRYHPARSQHSALNTLLQGAGAILMKRALVIADERLQAMGFKHSGTLGDEVNYEFVANIHDELQVEADEDIAETVGGVLKDAIKQAGEYYNFACPLSGSYAVGTNWSQTH